MLFSWWLEIAGGGKGKEPVSITRSVAGQEIVESQDPSSTGRENKGNEKWGRDSKWEGSFQGRGKKKAMFLMEGKREAEIVESGGVWVFGRNSYLQFFISVILMGVAHMVTRIRVEDGRCYECCVFAREWAYDLACVVISSVFFWVNSDFMA